MDKRFLSFFFLSLSIPFNSILRRVEQGTRCQKVITWAVRRGTFMKSYDNNKTEGRKWVIILATEGIYRSVSTVFFPRTLWASTITRQEAEEGFFTAYTIATCSPANGYTLHHTRKVSRKFLASLFHRNAVDEYRPVELIWGRGLRLDRKLGVRGTLSWRWSC